MDKPTILVVNPNTSDAMTVAIDRIAWEAAGTSANVVTRRSLQGPHTIEGPLDAALGVAGMLEVVGAYPYSFDTVVVACFGDPGVDALRLLVHVPVIGIGAASFTQAGANTTSSPSSGGRTASSAARRDRAKAAAGVAASTSAPTGRISSGGSAAAARSSGARHPGVPRPTGGQGRG